jgi:membrane protease YdiL (CAAX protease family)
MGPWDVAAFAALTLAVLSLWIPRPAWSWMVPGALALAFAFVSGLIDHRAALGLLAFAAACIAANRARGLPAAVAAHAIMVAIGAGLFLHLMPGFDNPRVIGEVVIGHDALPYSKFLNFDKGLAGLFLLGLYAPDRVACDKGIRHVPGMLWRLAVTVVVVMALSFAIGYVRWDPKLPVFWPIWTWSMVILTAMPEEAAFRAVLQTGIARRFDAAPPAAAIVVAGLLFGIAHLAGGPGLVLLATVAGIGYGWVYASTGSIGLAILTHAGLNAMHLLFFTYPALA